MSRILEDTHGESGANMKIIYLFLGTIIFSVFVPSCSNSNPNQAAHNNPTKSDATPDQLKALSNNPFFKALSAMPKTDQFVHELGQKARTNLDLVGLSRWAESIAQSNLRSRKISFEEIPKDVREFQSPLIPFSKIEVIADTRSPVIWVEWGGGFGHWGLALTTNTAALATVRIHTELVTNRIYVFMTTDQ